MMAFRLVTMVFLCSLNWAVGATWTDLKGREMDATLLDVEHGVGTFRLSRDGSVITYRASKLAKESGAILRKFEKNKRLAKRVRVKVIQSIEAGSRCAMDDIVLVETGTVVDKGIGGDVVRRKQPGAMQWQLVSYSDEVFIEGLTNVPEGEELTVYVWPRSPMSFESVLGAMRTLEAFKCLP